MFHRMRLKLWLSLNPALLNGEGSFDDIDVEDESSMSSKEPSAL